jgi:hypothetical protein
VPLVKTKLSSLESNLIGMSLTILELDEVAMRSLNVVRKLVTKATTIAFEKKEDVQSSNNSKPT